jgi:hypothetical protein
MRKSNFPAQIYIQIQDEQSLRPGGALCKEYVKRGWQATGRIHAGFATIR